MKVLERGAVYGGLFGEDTIGYRCQTCNDIFQSMFGDECRGCREDRKRHQEIVKAISDKSSKKWWRVI